MFQMKVILFKSLYRFDKITFIHCTTLLIKKITEYIYILCVKLKL